jgi:hypothetical protein
MKISSCLANCGLKKQSLHAPAPKCHWNMPPERVRAPSARSRVLHEALSQSRVVWECSPKLVVSPI